MMQLLLLINQDECKNGGLALTQTILLFIYSQHILAQTGRH
jgi:hypothetical protein